MPTLADIGTFGFHEKAKITDEMKEWLQTDTAISIITKCLKKKIESTPSKRSKIYFLQGRTGSGKSTLMISSLFKSLILGTGGKLYCSEPRVNLARSNAEDVSRYNPDLKLGDRLGVLTGAEKIVPTNQECIYYCTTQILSNLLIKILEETNTEKALRQLSRIKIGVIDEVHQLELPNLSLMKTTFDVLEKYGDRLECPIFIYASATLDITRMVKYYFPKSSLEIFADPLIIGYVSGAPNFDVDVKFLSDSEMSTIRKRENIGINNRQMTTGFKLMGEYVMENILPISIDSKSFIYSGTNKIQCRDILIIVPSKAAIEAIGDEVQSRAKLPFFRIKMGTEMSEVTKWRNEFKGKSRLIFIGFARGYSPAADYILTTTMDTDMDALAFETKIYASTPILESGKTLSALYCGVDAGQVTQPIRLPLIHDINNIMSSFRVIPANRNQVIQRQGRVGREASGMFVHFYTKEAYDKFLLSDTADTVNNANLSSMIVQSLSIKPLFTKVSLVSDNNYLFPMTTDILIRSYSDLFRSGFITYDGSTAELVNQYKIAEPWILFAQYLHFVKGMSLWTALLTAAMNMRSIPQILSITDISVKSLRFQIEDYKKIPVDIMIMAIKYAKNAMMEILYDNANKFPANFNNLY